jgi:CheY-like chemotaxis protein
VTVLLVEDVTELRSVLRQSLGFRGGFDVVAEVGDGASAIVAAARHQPDVVVLDLGLPDIAGHEVLTQLRAVAPAAQVVVYTGSVTPEGLPPARVEAFVSKDNDVGYLVDLLATLSHPRYETAAVDLGPRPADVPAARRFLAEHCRRWACEELLDDAQIVVTELVTNAFLHAGTRCELRAGLTDRALRLQVTDYGSGMPDPQAADDRAEGGRGLLLVSTLCVAWGVEALPGGAKVVWAELLTEPASGARMAP